MPEPNRKIADDKCSSAQINDRLFHRIDELLGQFRGDRAVNGFTNVETEFSLLG
jgi:hypothetical protein